MTATFWPAPRENRHAERYSSIASALVCFVKSVAGSTPVGIPQIAFSSVGCGGPTGPVGGGPGSTTGGLIAPAGGGNPTPATTTISTAPANAAQRRAPAITGPVGRRSRAAI